VRGGCEEPPSPVPSREGEEKTREDCYPPSSRPSASAERKDAGERCSTPR
jgi:hypothetical protein